MDLNQLLNLAQNKGYKVFYKPRVIVAKQEIKDKLIEVLNLKIENE